MPMDNHEQRRQPWAQWGEMGKYFCVLSDYMLLLSGRTLHGVGLENRS